MTRGGVFGLRFAGGQSCSDKIYLRRLQGSRCARAAEDNAAPRRSCSDSSLRGRVNERMRIAGLRCGRPRSSANCIFVLAICSPTRRSLLPHNLINKKRATRDRAALSDGISCSDYSKWGPAATSDLPSSLPVNFEKFLMKRPARSLAFSFHCEASA